jgi:hypothetical protein
MDDTTFYKAIDNTKDFQAIAPAITATQDWSEANNMILNTEKTVVMNTWLSHQYSYTQPIELDGVAISPNPSTRFLGIIMDKNLTFSEHVAGVTAKCNSRLFLMKKLKAVGLSLHGLKTFYVTNIRSVICYAAPAW